MASRLLILAFLLLANSLHADDPRDTPVAEALRASLLNDASRIDGIAAQIRADEKSADTPKSERLAASFQVLALTSREQLPNLSEARRALSGYTRSPTTRALDRTIRRAEPRQRYREARADRRYETVRRTFNGIVVPITGAFQGQIFALLAMPFDAADELIVGRRFLTPEQRRELRTGRTVAELLPESAEARSAESMLDSYAPKRTSLAVLQANQNGREAFNQDRFVAAEFWYRRALSLQNRIGATSPGYEKVLQQQNRSLAQQREANIYLNVEALARTSEELLTLGDLLRLALAEDVLEFRQEATTYRDRHQDSAFIASVDAMEAALIHRAGESRRAGTLLQRLANDDSARSWQPRAAGHVARPVYRPAISLAEAQGVIKARWRSYVFAGTDPEVIQRSFEAEESRLRRQSWVARARGLFVIDTLARVLFLPLTPPIPEPELLDAAARVPDASWWETPAGQRWRARVAIAERRERRYNSAAISYSMVGNEGRARSMRQKAARTLERLGDQSSEAGIAAAYYDRLVNAYPDYKRLDRVQRSLEDAEARRRAVAVIRIEELRRLPELTADGALPIDSALFNGKRADGEIDKGGLYLLDGGALSYRDRDTGERVEIPASEEQINLAASLLEPRRRANRIDEEVRQPLPRRKIPAAVDIGFFPGFDASPSLVPLDPDMEERRLYR